MGTNRSPELVKEIAEAVSFDKMKVGKTTATPSKESMEMVKSIVGPKHLEENHTKLKKATVQIYRKGVIGDWKNHFTVAQNEMFDDFLADWEGGKDIPFVYTQE
ncbi:sulfotransferase 1C2-like [Watersipora subatra]|uniref:sulfotransferase 1C2-like n=1 Tax=Watersipora subatra TaxID=2589382 RepID=UPI00355B3A14